MNQKPRIQAAPVFGAGFSRNITPPRPKGHTMRKSILTVLIAMAAVMGLSSSAMADSVGQCNQYPGNTINSVSEWQHVLASEGVLGQASSEIFTRAGYVAIDQTPGQWISKRVMTGNAPRSFSGQDYGCRDGRMFPAGSRSYEKNKSVFWVLPKNYKKSDISTHRTKAHSRRIRIKVDVIGLQECGNTFFAVIEIEIWVVAKKHVVKKHKVKPKPVPPPVVPPVVTPPVEPPVAVRNCSAIAIGATWSTVVNACVVNICGNVTIITGSNDKVEQGGNCNTEEPPRVPTCVENGEVGTYPNCRPHNCEETGTCPPPPHCENGEVGTYPNCRPPTCQELGNCPPPPSPPTLVDVTRLNDVEAGGTSPNFCATAELSGNDTGTLIMSPEYGSFGPQGGTVTFTVKGTQKVCATYYAPTEVPPGGNDKMRVTLRDNNTGVSATSDTQEFRIDPEPVNPS